MGFVSGVEKKSERAEASFKSELSRDELEEIFKKYPNVPTFFQTLV
jgi:hypothetical protein